MIVGPNASGKTSLLESIAYLGRGRSFRGAATRDLIRHGQSSLLLFGRVDSGGRTVGVGVRNGRDGLEVHTDGSKRSSAAALAEALPLQVVDPEVHRLVAGGPDDRRRYLDWMAFHVEQGYLDVWRRYKRALKQRNAALRSGAQGNTLAGWDAELAELGVVMHKIRIRVLELARPALQEAGASLLGEPFDVEYQQGWAAEKELLDAIRESLVRDQNLGTSHVGPHRADLKLRYDERQARKLVSRGQQKLMACALILAATETVQDHLGQALLLLLDDPAAELDAESLGKLMEQVGRLGCQVIATSLDANPALFADAPRAFHVEHGQVEQDA